MRQTRVSRSWNGLSLVCLAIAAGCIPTGLHAADSTTESGSSASSAPIDFNRDIRSLLFGKCVTCHGPDEEERAAGLRLDTADGAHEDLGGYAAVIPGDADESELILRITSDDEDTVMPPPGKGEQLSAAEVDLLKQWIQEGGQYAKHWSYEVPRRPPLPKVDKADWPNGAIDHFTLAKLAQRGLEPSPQADRLTLARRVSIDLTGLPPTWEQAKAFADDTRPDAYEHYVNALLDSPTFGERWARVWLDLARYADSAGYADDPPRTIWSFRDYVINALNNNKPFDQFTIEQIAGDLLPHPTEEQLVATAFNRNTLTNNEGGTNDEEFRNAAVVDRVNTTMAVWMGTTMACAQCHTHKYDPITHEDYFSFFALFNSTEDTDKKDERPFLELWTESGKARKAELETQIDSLKQSIEKPSEIVNEQRGQWLANVAEPPQWNVAQIDSVDSQRNITIADDGWAHATDDDRETDTYKLKLPTSGQAITGIRLETSKSQDRNFVVSNVTATWAPSQPHPVEARFVRVDLPGTSKHLHLAEIEVFSADQNIATKGKASHSSTYADAVASRVNDGNTDGNYKNGSVEHTNQQDNPWVEIDLGSEQPIDQIAIWNRTDNGQTIIKRLNGFTVTLLGDDREVVWKNNPIEVASAKHSVSPSGLREISFTHAHADFQQSGFPAASTIKPESNPETGWAVAPKTGQPHELTLSLDRAIPKANGVLTVSIAQTSKHKQHLLDHFRLSISSDEKVTQWAQIPKPIQTLVLKDQSKWKDKDHHRIESYFREIAPALKDQRDKLDALEKKLAKMKPTTSVPVMTELPRDKRRVTHIQIRGNYQSKGDEVTEGTPKAFHPVDNADAPTRLDLAHWLVDPQNPLTARVIVNRHWEQLFGIGIVETSEEFGSQGELPTHPQLLDWMAVELQESGWDIKHLIKLIVMSATYRQSSVTTPEMIASDPRNRLLARGPRFRVSAEMVRDQALFVSGLLSDKRFGPPVKPPQPELGLTAAFGSTTDWKTSGGEDRYRRGLYTTWRRSNPYPSMAQFDAPNREVCTVRRIRTNTPLQALVTLNDPVYVEAAQSLARNMIAAGKTPEQRLTYAFQTALLRAPTGAEIDRLSALASEADSTYSHSVDDAKRIASDPLGDLPKNADPVEYAAWTVVANVILNLDEMFMKR